MKRILSLLMVTALIFSMSACTKKVEKEETTTDVETNQPSSQDTQTTTDKTDETKDDVATEPVSTIATEISGDVEIEFWHAMNGAHQDELVALTDKFNAENGMGITVKLVNQGGYSDLSKKIMASVASDQLPDMAQVYDNWIVNYLDKVVVLDDYINNDIVGLKDFDDIVQSYRDESHEFGAYYTMPFNKSTYLYFYNKTMLEELELDVPTTWDELYSVSEAVHATTGKPALGYDDLAGMFTSFTLQTGSEFVTQDGEVKFDSDGGYEALDFFFSMYSQGIARIAGEDGYHSGPFSNGDLFAYVGSSAGLAYITPNGFELGVASLQSYTTQAAPQSGTNLAMFADDDQKRLAVWEYMKYLTSVEATTEWAIATGYLPVRSSAFESEVFQAYLEDSDAMQAAYAQVPSLYYDPAYNNSYTARNLISTELEAALLEGTDSKTAVDNIAEKVRAEIAK